MALLLSTIVLGAGLPGCGGGGGGGGGGGQEGVATPEASLQAAEQIVDLLFAPAYGADENATSLRFSRRFAARMGVVAPLPRDAPAFQGTQTFECEDGGSVRVTQSWEGPADPSSCSQITDFEEQFTYDDCDEDGITQNGTVSRKSKGDGCCPSSATVNADISVEGGDDDFELELDEDITSFDCSDEDLAVSDQATFDATIEGTLNGDDVSNEYRDFTLSVLDIDISDSSLAGVTLDLEGEVSSLCTDGLVEFRTQDPLEIELDRRCPRDGQTRLSGETGTVISSYNANGSVDIVISTGEGDENVHLDNCSDADQCVELNVN